MAIDWRSHFLRQADYQVWANQVLFDSLARLHPDVLGAPEGLFFGSIHHTVDHMLAALRIWRARFAGESPRADFKQLQHPDWADLKQQLQHELRSFRHWLAGQPEAYFHRQLGYSTLNGARQENAVSDVLAHLMMHFVHHRGQISAVATRLGAPSPEMDFIYFVRAMERAARESQQAAQQQQ